MRTSGEPCKTIVIIKILSSYTCLDVLTFSRWPRCLDDIQTIDFQEFKRLEGDFLKLQAVQPKHQRLGHVQKKNSRLGHLELNLHKNCSLYTTCISQIEELMLNVRVEYLSLEFLYFAITADNKYLSSWKGFKTWFTDATCFLGMKVS